MNQLIECVPNFSEGRDMTIIKQITDEIEKVDGVKLLDVDPGKATNRTERQLFENGLQLEPLFLYKRRTDRNNSYGV